MARYDYHCSENDRVVEVTHPMTEKLATWGEVCERAKIPRGNTPSEAPVQRMIGVPNIQKTTGVSKLKEMGFTKLVRRDKGVYENITATGNESRIVNADNPATFPAFNKKVQD